MTDPKQSPAKVVLNAITYKEINDSKIGVPTPVSIDITDLLRQHNVLSSSIYGISNSGALGESVTYTAFVVREKDIRQIENQIYGVIDAAIVNTNQGLAVKGLIEGIIDSFIGKCWDNIRG
jgi:hypothetical protein